jgi:hypothetical protein
VNAGIFQGNSQAKTCAANGALPGRISAPESTEDTIELLGAHTHTMVSNTNGDSGGIGIHRHFDRLLLTVLNGITNQVHDNTADSARIYLGV